MNDLRRGDIYYAYLGKPQDHEIAGKKPVIIFQSDEFMNSNLLFIVPCSSSAIPKPRPNEVYLPKDITGLARDTVALCQHLRCLDRRKIQRRRAGNLPINHDLFYDICWEIIHLFGLDLVPLRDADKFAR